MQNWRVTRSDELYHHGVIGQRKGRRRYQYLDGSLTPEGREHYGVGPPREAKYVESGKLTSEGRARIKKIYRSKLIKQDNLRKIEEHLNKKDVGIVDNKDYDVIKKGSTIGRYSSKPHESMDRRKYAFVTKKDEKLYENLAFAGDLYIKDKEAIYSYKMSAIKDLKVAKGKEVADHIIQTYGDKKLNDAWKEYQELNLRDNISKMHGLKKDSDVLLDQVQKEYKNDKWAGDYAQKVMWTVRNELNGSLYYNEKINSETYNYYAKKGYDAIVDVEDWLGGYEYPIILLDPKNSVQVTDTKKIRRKKNIIDYLMEPINYYSGGH